LNEVRRRCAQCFSELRPCRSRDSSETRLVSTDGLMSISQRGRWQAARLRPQNTLMAGYHQIICENSTAGADQTAPTAGRHLIMDVHPLTDPPGLENRRPMCFLRGNILNLLQLGTQPQWCVCNGYGFTGFLATRLQR
jgi:hypothetical protein